MCNRPLPYDLRSPNPPRYFPFCSEKCRLVDLHKWLSEEYYITSPIETPEDEGNPSEKE
ncbi:DNA gyrase inhibitor YacG [bacterium]|nr:DNA gyrase inhibitor YacG [bacterium]